MGIRFGLKIIVENVEEFNSGLVPLLRGEFLKQGTRLIVQLGDKTLDLNEKFKIYFYLKNSNKIIPEFIQNSTNQILFSTTKSSLASQVSY